MHGGASPMQVKRGSVVYVMHHDSKMSRLIAWFMKPRNAPKDWKPWSHSAIVVDQGERDAWLCETTDTQIAYGSYRRYLEDPNCSIEVFEPIGVTEEVIKRGIEESENNVGSIYAYWQLLSWALACLLAKIGISFPNLLPYGWVCNSHVLDGIRHYPIEPFYGIRPQSIHTGQMYDMMKESKNWNSVFTKNAH